MRALGISASAVGLSLLLAAAGSLAVPSPSTAADPGECKSSQYFRTLERFPGRRYTYKIGLNGLNYGGFSIPDYTIKRLQYGHQAWDNTSSACLNDQENFETRYLGTTRQFSTTIDNDQVMDFGGPEHLCYKGVCASAGAVGATRNITAEKQLGQTLRPRFYETSIETDTRLNNRYGWSARADSVVLAGTYDVWAVMAHEAGHALGLDHVSDEWQTMYGSGSTGQIRLRDLGRGDVLGMRKIYPGSADEIPNCLETC